MVRELLAQPEVRAPHQVLLDTVPQPVSEVRVALVDSAALAVPEAAVDLAAVEVALVDAHHVLLQNTTKRF